LLSLVHVLEWRAAVHPGAVALSDQQGAELTYAALATAVERSAAGFAAAGVAPGDVVPVIARNQVGWVTAGFDTGALVSWARERLAGFKCPTGVTVVSELPRNATGKVLRAALRQPFWTGRDRLVS
jgi:acyl-CoA synthetase (AMP-forming)/AMP-acid ligase II